MAREPEDEAPRFWKTWKRIYITLILYWALVLILLILATRVLSASIF